MSKTALKCLIAIAALSVQAAGAAESKKDSWIMDTSEIGKSNHGVVTTEQFLELGEATPSCLQLEGENSMRLGNLNRAIMVFQQAVEQAPMDMDKRILYASALEKKLLMQKERDPKLYNFLVKQWLFIAKKAEFADQSGQGRSHLLNLTGKVPKVWDKSAKYLAEVLLPEDGSEKVEFGGKKKLAEK